MRRSIALLTIAINTCSWSPASACCLTDWLFGRTPSPYVVGFAPYGYAPGYSAGYAPVAAPYAANYPVATTTSVLQPSWGTAPPVQANGVYQAQRPTYYDNPSVYTGMPVATPYAAARVPFGGVYRGSTADTSSYFGAANQYPNTYTSGGYVASYGAAQVPVATSPSVAPGLPLSVTTPTGAPAYALPATPVQPLFEPTAPQPGGLARFFGSMFGTSYRSSYYRAPITYYRPATSIDPVSGTTVTVQQPCTSYAQQLQRTPYSSLQGPSTTYAQPAPGCSAPVYGGSYSAAPAPSPYAAAPGSYGTPGTSEIGQASAIQPVDQGQFTVPIPSTIAPSSSSGGYYDQGHYGPNTAPLTGAPNGLPSTQPYSAPAQSDATPLNQPELRNRPPASQNGYTPEPPQLDNNGPAAPKVKSYWELQDADDSTAMIRTETNRSPATPIHAPDDYVSPLKRPSESTITPVLRQSLEVPPLPPRTFESAEKSSGGHWVGAPVREASITRQPSYRPLPVQSVPAPIKRDTTWTPVSR